MDTKKCNYIIMLSNEREGERERERGIVGEKAIK
jgi:hypothetical protein